MRAYLNSEGLRPCGKPGEIPEAPPAADKARGLSEKTGSNDAAPRRQCDHVFEGTIQTPYDFKSPSALDQPDKFRFLSGKTVFVFFPRFFRGAAVFSRSDGFWGFLSAGLLRTALFFGKKPEFPEKRKRFFRRFFRTKTVDI